MENIALHPQFPSRMWQICILNRNLRAVATGRAGKRAGRRADCVIGHGAFARDIAYLLYRSSRGDLLRQLDYLSEEMLG